MWQPRIISVSEWFWVSPQLKRFSQWYAGLPSSLVAELHVLENGCEGPIAKENLVTVNVACIRTPPPPLPSPQEPQEKSKEGPFPEFSLIGF